MQKTKLILSNIFLSIILCSIVYAQNINGVIMDSKDSLGYSDSSKKITSVNTITIGTINNNSNAKEESSSYIHLVAGIFFTMLFFLALWYIKTSEDKKAEKKLQNNEDNPHEKSFKKLSALLETVRESGVEKGIVLLILLGGLLTGFVNYFGNGIDIYTKLYVAFGIAGFTFSTVFWLLVGYVKTTNKNLEEIGKHIEGQRDPLVKAKENKKLSHAQRHIAKMLYESTENSVVELINPVKGKSFNSISEYNSYLEKCIRKMIDSEHGVVYAVCRKKEWDRHQIWVDLNKLAIKNRVSVSRIFLPYEGMDDEKSKTYWKSQSDYGIRVLVPENKDEMKTHLESLLEGVDEHFGFVIFEFSRTEKEVVFHHNPEGKGSIAISDKLLIAQFKALFNDLLKFCKVYPDSKHNDNLSYEASKILELIYNSTRYLRNHRMSDLQMMFLLWRFKRENYRMKNLVNKEVTLEAKDKFSYLAEVYGHLIEMMQGGYEYYVVTLPEIWGSDDNLGSPEFMQNSIKAVTEKNAKVARVVYVKENKLDSREDDFKYLITTLKAVKLMEEELANGGMNSKAEPKFYIDATNTKDTSEEWPLAYMFIDNKHQEWLRIESEGLIKPREKQYPNFTLKYFNFKEDNAEKAKMNFLERHAKLWKEGKGIAEFKKILASKCTEEFKNFLRDKYPMDYACFFSD